MKLLVALLLMFSAAQSAPPPSTPITVGQSAGNCAGSVTTFTCYAVMMTVGSNVGTAWVYPQGQAGWIMFRPTLEGSDAVTATVTSATVNARDALGRTTQLTVTFMLTGDPNADGDTDAVNGTITFNIGYVLGGRWHNLSYPVITGGFGAQSISKD